MEVGRFYQRAGQWLAATYRFRTVVDQYQTTSHTPEALERLVECYLAFGVPARSAEGGGGARPQLSGKLLLPAIAEAAWAGEQADPAPDCFAEVSPGRARLRMLRQLAIHNIVLVERLELEFEPGLGVLTGETGAGKSILLDALGLALGARADTGLVRTGEDSASVSAEIDLSHDHPALGLLARARHLDRTGRSR